MADINWSFWLPFLVVALFILFIAVGIMQSFCYIVTANGMKDPKIYIFLGIILVGIIICLLLFQRIYSLLLLYNDMEKRKIQLLIERYKEDNKTQNRTINDLRSEIFRLQDLLSDGVFKANHDNLAKIYTDLGKLFFDLDKADDAEKLYLKALDLYKSLAKTNPNRYNMNVANTYIKLAEVVKKDDKRISAVQKNYEDAIEYYIILAKDNPKKFNKQLAQTYFELASLLKKAKNPKDAILRFEQALQFYLELDKNDPIKIEGITKTIDEFILLKNDNQKLALGELFKKALDILKKEYPDRNDIMTNIKNLLNITVIW
jgi:tetratricopeptide (TPR) repeat protein